VPAGGAAAAASTSFLLGRFTSTTTNQKINHVATQKLTAIASRPFAKPYHASSRFLSSAPKEVAKEVGGASGATAATVDGSKGFVHWYEGHLSSRPVTTKAITGSFLWGVGDFVAQVVPTYFAEDDVDDFTTGAVIKKEFAYDFPRTTKAVFFGFAIHAPLSHVHYNFLEWMTVKAGLQGLTITVFKTVMEQVSSEYSWMNMTIIILLRDDKSSYFPSFHIICQFVYWSWFSNCLYHGAMGMMNGMNTTQIYDRIADVLMPTQYAQWSFVSRNEVNIDACMYAHKITRSLPRIVTLTVDPGAITEFSICSSEASTKCCSVDERCMDRSFKCVVPPRGEESGG